VYDEVRLFLVCNLCVAPSSNHTGCSFRAWVFAAGLILGFSLFAYDDAESRGETESAFQSARHVLRNLATLSPQAKHYDEILTSFAEAIFRHRQQNLSARQSVADRYIDCVLDIDVSIMEPMQRQGYPDAWEQPSQVPRPSAPESGVDNGSSNIGRVDGSDSDIAAGLDLDGFNVLPFDDGVNLSIDYEPFGLLLDGI
jgi:hypothetical protein